MSPPPASSRPAPSPPASSPPPAPSPPASSPPAPSPPATPEATVVSSVLSRFPFCTLWYLEESSFLRSRVDKLKFPLFELSSISRMVINMFISLGLIKVLILLPTWHASVRRSWWSWPSLLAVCRLHYWWWCFFLKLMLELCIAMACKLAILVFTCFWVWNTFETGIQGYVKQRQQQQQFHQLQCLPVLKDWYFKYHSNNQKNVGMKTSYNFHLICFCQDHVGTMWRPNHWLTLSMFLCHLHLLPQLFHPRRFLQMTDGQNIRMWKLLWEGARRPFSLGLAMYQEKQLRPRRRLQREQQSSLNPTMRHGQYRGAKQTGVKLERLEKQSKNVVGAKVTWNQEL